jgi:hypothetical protein
MQALPTTLTNYNVTNLTAGRTYYWFVEARDSGNTLLAASEMRRVVACSSNCSAPPQFLSTADGYGQCGVPYSYSSSGTPQVGGTGPFTFSVGVAAGESAPAGMNVDPSTGEFQWTPTNQDEGLHHVQLTATGPGGASTQAYDLVVTCPNGKASTVGCACGAAPGSMVSVVGALLWLMVRVRQRRARRRRREDC